MTFLDYRTSFDTLMGVKSVPNERERLLFARAEKYIRKVSWIPGLRMVAVVNSLSMYATSEESDIDLFIVTSRGTMWFVRSLVTFVFWKYGVWRHGEDIAGHFCLSFFVTEDAMDMSKIAIEDDIYLYYWMYHMKPVLVVGDTWERFQMINDKGQMIDREQWNVRIKRPRRSHFEFFAKACNMIIRPLGEWRSRKTWREKGKPEGVIISKDMLKFHDQDQRKNIRDRIMTMAK